MYLCLIRYVNNVFQEIISIVDTRLGIDFFFTKAEAEAEFKILKLRGNFYD